VSLSGALAGLLVAQSKYKFQGKLDQPRIIRLRSHDSEAICVAGYKTGSGHTELGVIE
jgi:hypothetical protein